MPELLRDVAESNKVRYLVVFVLIFIKDSILKFIAHSLYLHHEWTDRKRCANFPSQSLISQIHSDIFCVAIIKDKVRFAVIMSKDTSEIVIILSIFLLDVFVNRNLEQSRVSINCALDQSLRLLRLRIEVFDLVFRLEF